jgi:Flp pilus assembly protein TadG
MNGASMLFGQIRRFRRDASGVATIEVGLAFPFIVMFASGLFEYGALFYNYELLQTGVRDAARYLARVENPSTSETAARNLALRGTVDSTGALRVSWWQSGDIQITYETTSNPVNEDTGRRLYRGPDPLTVIRVSTELNYSGLGLLRSVGLGPIKVTAAHEERYVGQ